MREMARCPACSGLIRAKSALRCPFCGVSLSASETRTAAGILARHASSLQDPPGSCLTAIGDARFAPGDVFAARFRIVSLLGRGAMGEVYRADDLRLGQPVALKLLTDLGPRRRDALARFTREVRLARTIAHPNVCRVFDIGEAEDWHYLSMEYVDGETLVSVRDRIGRLPPEKAYDVASQLCAGLAAAHEHGVLHRDLKPANIMLDGRGRVRIMDFGLAMQAGDRVDRIAGTPAYIAPEQLAGEEPTERSDLFSLGLVIYEIVTGTWALRASSFVERAAAPFHPGTLSFPAGTDPRVIETIRQCLASDPTERPRSALHVAAQLPGGDAISAALADGRVPTPDIVASTPSGGALAPVVAVSALSVVIAGLALIGFRGDILTVAPSDVPKPPEVLAERARELLSRMGNDSKAVDQEFGFEHVDLGGPRKTVRFVFRSSPEPLKPFNLLHIVTRSDPPNDLPGMATVTLDPSGRLLGFSRIVTSSRQPVVQPAWPDVFREANLDFNAFSRAQADQRPLVPHDDATAWVRRESDAAPVRVTGATLAQIPVAFDAQPMSGEDRDRGVITTGRSRLSEGVLWVIVVVTFCGTAVMVRRHLRAGEGDLHGARTLAAVAVVGGVLSTQLQAHHVPDAFHELVVLLSGTGWCLVWSGFSWLAYLAFEPHVRRLWPRTLITWTRVLSGRFHDSLVGRDLLLGILAGTLIAVASLLVILLHQRSPADTALLPALHSLRSSRLFVSRLVFLALDSLQLALGALFMLVLLRVVLKRTWLAVFSLLLLNLPLTAWNWTPTAVVYALATAGLFCVVVLRLGLLAGVAMLATERLLTSLPITLDFDAWYIASSGWVLVLVLGLALVAFRLTLLHGGLRAPIAVVGHGHPTPAR
jgi:serine/threonine protein kinase